MAKIVLGMWSTHGPILNTTPEEWMLRVINDKRISHWFKGQQYAFNELVELRKDEHFAEQFTLEERTRRHAQCQAGVARLAEIWKDVKPDVAVIMGNDQRELVLPSLQPMFTVYHGDTFWQKPLPEAQAAKLPVGIKESEWAYRPEEDQVWPALPDLAELVLAAGQERGFDFAASNAWPDMGTEHHHIGTPHAFSWIIRRVMEDAAVPVLPIITNTFFSPNQPTAKRCFEMGKLVGDCIRQWDRDVRVAVFGSGGMSHFTINEDFDRDLLQALEKRDQDFLTSIPQEILMSGTSEIRNWIAAAGALMDTDLSGETIDYIPCYRSEAGTGTAQGFVCWR
jgi:OH-DDVA oxygenase